MSTDASADVVIIGKELAGFATGALLAHAGRRVVMLDDGEDGDTEVLEDHLVPTAPALFHLPETGHAARLMDALGLRARAREELGPRSGLGLIDDPDVRMTLYVDEERRLRELQRIFGDEGSVYDGFFRHLELDARDRLLDEAARLDESTGLFNRAKIRSRQASLGAAADMRRDQVVERLGQTGLGAAARQMGPLVQSLLQPPEGLAGYISVVHLSQGSVAETKRGFGLRGSLRALFADVITGHGGTFANGKVERIEADRRVREIVVGNKRYAPKVIIDATTLRTLSQRLPDGKKRTQTKALEDGVPFSGASAIVRWILDDELVPKGLAKRSILLSDDADAHPPILVGVYPAVPKSGDSGKRSERTAIVAASRGKVPDSASLADDIEARLDALLPFAKARLHGSDNIVGSDARRAFPAFGQSEELLRGRRPKTAYANYFRAGRDLAPSLGFGGELASARAVATAVERALGNKKPALAGA